MTKREYFELLEILKGKTIAIVYIYEGENAIGFGHYDIWKSDLISCWLNAVQELQCIPYIMDVRTFLYKVANNTLPPIDYVINMNAGCAELSTLGLVPSVCGFIGKECIPCDTGAIISGENKNYANMIAKSLNFKVPKASSDEACIYRPLNYGSSKGIKRIKTTEIIDTEKGIYQEFITGYDVTIPFIYNPLTNMMESLPALFYLPTVNTPSWYFDADAKKTITGFKRILLPNVSGDLIDNILRLIRNMGIDTYCRIDFRLKTEDTIFENDISKITLNTENAYFIEINPMPTIQIGNNFGISFDEMTKQNHLYKTKELYDAFVGNASMHGFILSCALLKRIISKH